MIVIAILLIAAAVGFGAAVALQANESVSVDMLGLSADTASREIFFAGVLTAVVLGVGLWLLKTATARARRRRREVKDLKRGGRAEVERLEAEKAQLESALRQERTTPPASAQTSRARKDTAPAPAAAPAAAPSREPGGSSSIDLTAAERKELGL